MCSPTGGEKEDAWKVREFGIHLVNLWSGSGTLFPLRSFHHVAVAVLEDSALKSLHERLNILIVVMGDDYVHGPWRYPGAVKYAFTELLSRNA